MIASLWREHRIVITVALALHLTAGFLSVGYYAADEHFQILEFAGMKLGINQPDDLPWEYPTRMRPALQPAMAYVAIRALTAVGMDNPFDQVTVLRLVSALVSLLGMFLLIRAFQPELGSQRLKRWLVYLSFLLWFMPFQHVRFCSETWSGLAFFMGLALLWPAIRDRDQRQTGYASDLLIGFLFGASFLFRYQAGIWVAALFLWLVIQQRNQLPRVIKLAAGSLLAIGVGVLLDRWFYGAWTLTAWNYLKLNLIDGQAAQFGTQPLWSYFSFVHKNGIMPISTVMIGSFLILWLRRPGHVLTWITVAFLGVHLLIGHKELRFMFPLVNIVPVVMVLAAQIVTQDARLQPLARFGYRYRKVLLALFVAVNSVVLVYASTKPAEPLVYLFRHIYENYDGRNTALTFSEENPYGRVVILAKLFPTLPSHLNNQIDAAGYVPLLINFYRHRDLPMKWVSTPGEARQLAAATDRTVLYTTPRLKLPGEWETVVGTRLYRFLPDWVTHFNPTDWTSRTQIWTLYGVNGR